MRERSDCPWAANWSVEPLQPVPKLRLRNDQLLPPGAPNGSEMTGMNSVISFIRWGLLIGASLWGGYLAIWAYQSASFSVAAEPILAEIYKTRAITLLPLGVAISAIGILFFLVLSPRRAKRND